MTRGEMLCDMIPDQFTSLTFVASRAWVLQNHADAFPLSKVQLMERGDLIKTLTALEVEDNA